jgi:D,D-heptose 1,7-bisphosphate phosphatase
MPRAVFLDRDDTLMDTHGVTASSSIPGDLADASLVRLLPGVPHALRQLKDAGFALVVFTSQGVVSRGGATLAQVETVNDRLRTLILAESGVTLDGLYYCPFHPAGSLPRFRREHPWRKPGPGMILAAAAELHLDLARSWAVGDMPRDPEAGINAGLPKAHCLQLAPGTPFPTLAAATAHILSH